MKKISVIGIGRLGGALAIALDKAGFELDQLVFRKGGLPPELPGVTTAKGRVVRIDEIDRIDSDLVIIATPDGSIASAAESLAGKLSRRTVALHTSGALSSEVLEPLRVCGNPTGSIHPLVSVSDPKSGATLFDGAYFCIEGSPEALAASALITDKLGGIAFTVAAKQKPLYHAAASMASGHLVALLETCIECLVECGLERDFAKEMILPLVRSTVENFSSKDAEKALTGPFARADVETVSAHLDAFESAELTEAPKIYLELGGKALEIAEKSGIEGERAAALRDLINIAKAKSR
ncbi:MAG: DUF2520 domain-containing protein [Chloracidobacterium sp.]|nr:DUF2520 domain-containing protein [Chloracidobacterium sp.]